MKSLLVFAAVALLAVPSATAHYRLPIQGDAKVQVEWGFLDEPVTTFQRTGLDLGLWDKVGHNLTLGANELHTLNVSLTRGGFGTGAPTLYMTGGLYPQPGRPGWYSYPIIFTQPGRYTLRIDGFINGTRQTFVDQPSALPVPHYVGNSTDVMFPTKYGDIGSQQARIEQLEADVEVLRVQVARLQPVNNAPGLSDLAIDLALLAVAAIAASRRGRVA